MGQVEVIIVTLSVVFLIIVGILWSVQPENINEVVIYVAHDQDYSEPILKDFERETGIKVRALYDTETTKTVGLVNKLIAEKDNPQADVFWNNEVSRTIELKEKNILQKYCSPSAVSIPSKFKDKDCYWTGFAARARVIIYNTNLVNESEAPKSIFELADKKWKGKVCIANPLFGTTGTHIAALFALMGENDAKEFLQRLKENDIKIVASNSMVRDQVVAGECWIGITDTDDANDAIVEGKPIKMIFPDQGENEIGTLIIPNSVMMIKGAPHKENAQKLIDYLLSKNTERKLVETKAIQMPTREDVPTPENVPKLNEIKGMNVSDYEIYQELNKSREFVQNVFIE